MKIAFIDFIDWDYDVDTPYEAPLGGGQSGFCYLAAALADRGHDVVMITGTSRPGVRRGVDCRRLEDLYEDEIRALELDALIVLNASEALDICLRLTSANTRLILWAQHAADQPAMAALGDRAAHLGWNGVACLTAYHRQQFIDAFGLDPDRTVVLGNGIAPAFETLFAPGQSLAEVKTAPILAYTSTPFRGLAYLIQAFPAIRRAVPGATLKVFSSMKVYAMGDDEDPYGELYRACERTEGIEYFGSVSQPVLAAEMKTVKVLAYPNTFAETQCIGAMEALAAGARVVTSEYGALPETTAGFAELIPMGPPDKYLPAFVDKVVRALTEPPDDHVLKAARAHYVDRHTWAHRARQWEDWLTS